LAVGAQEDVTMLTWRNPRHVTMWSRRLTSAVSFPCADVRELEEEEEEELDCSTPEVVNKYQFAGNVANGTCVSR
jgi:hypothetical protein